VERSLAWPAPGGCRSLPAARRPLLGFLQLA
jgi:hypothetical protein